MPITRKQVLVQLSDELIEMLDHEAARRGVSRSALIRAAVEDHLQDETEAEKIARWLDGYRRMPETEEEMRWAEESARRMVEEEPW